LVARDSDASSSCTSGQRLEKQDARALDADSSEEEEISKVLGKRKIIDSDSNGAESVNNIDVNGLKSELTRTDGNKSTSF
jgi:hypothetical protein